MTRRRMFTALATLAVLLLLGAVVGAWYLSVPRWRGPVSDHFDGRRFHNREPTADKGLLTVLRWQLGGTATPWPAWVDAAPGPRPAARVDGGGLRVTLVNHATLLVQMDGVNVLTDPVWSERVGPARWLGPKRRRPPGLRFDELPPIHAVLVSHNHYDHMDVPTLRRLAGAHGSARLAVPLGNGAYLARFGVPGAHELDWGDTLEVAPGVRVIAAPAQHWSSRTPFDRRHALWSAFVIEGPSGRVYVGGDTGDGAHFAEAGRRLGPFRLALLPIGAFLPRWFMRDHHIGPDQALAAARALNAETSVVMHYGTWALGDDGMMEPVDSLRAELARLGGAAPRVLVLEHGVGWDAPPAEPAERP